MAKRIFNDIENYNSYFPILLSNFMPWSVTLSHTEKIFFSFMSDILVSKGIQRTKQVFLSVREVISIISNLKY